jgi:hypothetical protein
MTTDDTNKPPRVQPRVKAAPRIRQLYWCDFLRDAHLPEFWKCRAVRIASYKSNFPAQNCDFAIIASGLTAMQAAGPGRRREARGRESLSDGALFHGAADVDEVIGNHAEPDPALHSGLALVSASVEAMPSLGDADASLASGAPFLPVAEPALALLPFCPSLQNSPGSAILPQALAPSILRQKVASAVAGTPTPSPLSSRGRSLTSRQPLLTKLGFP